MVAYSFKQRFASRILDGSKRQTIRADRRRHARPGEQLQLYTGMRTKHCKLIARVACEIVSPVRLVFDATGGAQAFEVDGRLLLEPAMLTFARADGFNSIEDMAAFWRAEHPGIDDFRGWVIRWGVIGSAA